MPAANPVSTEASSRPGASARAGSARPSESGFSGQLAEALAAPMPGATPQQAPVQPPAAEKSEPPPSAAQAAGTAPAASAPAADALVTAAAPSDPELPSPPTSPGDAVGQDGVAATQADDASPDELTADAVQAGALSSDLIVPPAPMPQPPAGQEHAAVIAAPEAPPDDARSDAAPSPTVAAAGAEAPRSSTDEKASSEQEPSLPDVGTLVADVGQVASPHATASLMPSPPDAVSFSAIQPHAPAHAAKADATPTAAAPPPPTTQVAPAVAALFSTTATDGMQRIVVRLDPIELGQVEVRVERAEGGPAAVALTVERPETLLLLVRDQAGLHRALDQAGVPPEGRTVQFQLGQQDAGTPGQQPDLSAGGGWGGFGGQSARQGRGEPTRGWRHAGQGEADPSMRAAWGRAGVDITA